MTTLTSPRAGAAPRDLLDAVSAERLLADTQALCREVRLSGTPEEARAFDLIEARCRELGLDVRRYAGETLISLPGPASLRVLGSEPLDLPCITHAFARSTPSDGLEGELVYVGAGSDADFGAASVAGKIAVIDGLAGPVPVRRAEQFGCFAQVFVNAGLRHEMILSPVWGAPVPATADRLPRSVCVTLDEADGARLKAQLRQGPARARLTTRIETGWRTIPTLTAEVQGSPSDGTFVLFGAHVDSWHYGATDNATGNALQLELARLLAARRDDLRRGVRFAFWSGHSHGRYAGSTWYADHLFQDLYERAVLYINVDTPGGRGASVLNLIDVMDETRDLVQRAVQQVVPGVELVGKRIARYADQSFWGIGLPSAFASVAEQPLPEGDAVVLGPGQASGSAHKSGGFGFWWHTTEDTFDKVDAAGLRRDAQICLAAVWDVVTSPVLPFDYGRLARAIVDHLAALPTTHGVDLRPALEAAERLVAATERLARLAASDAEQVNRALRHLGRTLLPVLFTTNGPFEHDPALPQGFLPGLDPLRKLAALEPASEEAALLRTALVRQRNRVVWALLEAARTAEEVVA
jgi:hypothetical protein